MLKAFVKLFEGGDVLFYVLLCLAIILFVAEVFIPSFGIVGLSGMLMTIGAVTERCITGENSSNEILLFIFYIVLLIVAVCLPIKLIYRAVLKRRKKNKTAMVKGNKVPLTEEGNANYSFLVGKVGEVVSDLRPSGKAVFDGKIYEVTTSKEYIYSGATVKAIKVYAQKIVVRKI